MQKIKAGAIRIRENKKSIMEFGYVEPIIINFEMVGRHSFNICFLRRYTGFQFQKSLSGHRLLPFGLLHMEEKRPCSRKKSVPVAARALSVWLEERRQAPMVLGQKVDHHPGIRQTENQ